MCPGCFFAKRVTKTIPTRSLSRFDIDIPPGRLIEARISVLSQIYVIWK